LDVHHGAKEVDDVGIVGSPNGVGHDATILGRVLGERLQIK
jgi:hypothetical protein